MGKAPAFQFYVRDWLSDPQLKMASHQSKGIWIDGLCYFWESPERGIISGTIQEFCRMFGTTETEFLQFLDEAKRLHFASVTESNGIITLENRRMVRDEKERKNNALRQARHRGKSKGNAKGDKNVTPASSSSSSIDTTYVVSDPNDDPKDIPIPGNNNCPHEKIIDLYHEILPMLARVKRWTPKRQKYLKARWTSSNEYQDLEWWKRFFGYIAKDCPYLLGNNNSQWSADLEWICIESNFVKIQEGRYERR